MSSPGVESLPGSCQSPPQSENGSLSSFFGVVPLCCVDAAGTTWVVFWLVGVLTTLLFCLPFGPFCNAIVRV